MAQWQGSFSWIRGCGFKGYGGHIFDFIFGINYFCDLCIIMVFAILLISFLDKASFLISTIFLIE